MTAPKDTADSLWLHATSQARQPWAAARHPGEKPHHAKADETTLKVRELTKAATDQRHANIARLKQARLDKEAEIQGSAAPSAPAKGSRSKR